MSPQDQIQVLTAQLQALQAQLDSHTPAPAKLPKVATPTPFGGTHDNLNQFKAKCGLYMSMWTSEFQDERSQILFVLSYMKGGMARPWATQRINNILSEVETVPQTFKEFAVELNMMFTDPNHEATAHQKLATA